MNAKNPTNTSAGGESSSKGIQIVLPPSLSKACVDALYLDAKNNKAGVPLQYFLDAVESSEPQRNARFTHLGESRLRRAYRTALQDQTPLADLEERIIVSSRYAGDAVCRFDGNFFKASPRTELRYGDVPQTFRAKPQNSAGSQTAPKKIPYLRWEYGATKALKDAADAVQSAIAAKTKELIKAFPQLGLFSTDFYLELSGAGNNDCSLDISADLRGISHAITAVDIVGEFAGEKATLEDRLPRNVIGEKWSGPPDNLGTHYSRTIVHKTADCDAIAPCRFFWTLEDDAIRNTGLRVYRTKIRNLDPPVNGSLAVRISAEIRYYLGGSTSLGPFPKDVPCR